MSNSEDITFLVDRGRTPAGFTPHDPVAAPAHYRGDNGTELIDFLDASPHLGPYEWQIFRYVYRWRSKGGLEDLRKAQWYLTRLIARQSREDSHGKA